MTLLAADAERLDAQEISRAPRFAVELVRDWKQAALRCDGLDAPTPFQHGQWLEAWYDAFAGADNVESLIAVITDAATARQVAVLPLIRRLQNGIRIIEFADCHLTDYNAPFFGPAAPHDTTTVRLLWKDLRAALRRLPGGADLIRLRKMPAELDGRPNPLALLPGAGPSSLNGNVVTTGEDYDAWRFTLERTVRKELERSWRVFTRDPQTQFRIVTNKDEAMRVLATMELQQSTRMQHLGLNYTLDDASCVAFYHNLVRNGVGKGYAVLTTLMAGDDVVAALLGIRRGSHYVMVRISNAADRWTNCSPGRLIIERTMAALHAEGVRQFDFSIGNYAYKRRFGVAHIPLVDVTAALSWRGLPYALRDRAARELHRRPQLAGKVRRIIGKASHEEP